MRITTKGVMVRAAILSMVVTVSGCLDDDRAFYIVENQLPGSSCTFSANAGNANPRGILDLEGKQGYWMYPLLYNALLSTEQWGDGEPERNIMFMRGFEVELDLGDIPGSYSKDLLSFYDPSSGTLEPEGYLISRVKVVPDRLSSQMPTIPKGLSALVMASVRAVATHGEKTKKSAEFLFPIDVCSGCLVDFRETCPTSKDKIMTNDCGLPQDTPVTCCNDTYVGFTCFTSSTTTGT